jgi:hypothetical protein
VTTNSSDYLKVFNLEPSGTVFSEPMEIRIKYDPSQVYDPRLLSIKRVSADGTEEILKVKRIDYANSELVFETEHFSTFIIEKDLNIFSWGDTSFEKWDEQGMSSEVIIKDSIFKKYTPYHYLADSLAFYCDKNGLDNTKCTTWLRYFRSKEFPSTKEDTEVTANIIQESYAKTLKKKDNYAVFTRNYNTWLLAKKSKGSLPFPYMNLCRDNAKGCYEDIKKYTYDNDLEGNSREYNFFTYLDYSSNLAHFYFDSDFTATLLKVNSTVKYIQTGTDLYDSLIENDIRSDKYIVTKFFTTYVAKEIIGAVPILGNVYSEVFDYGVNLTDKWATESVSGDFAATGSLIIHDGYFNQYMHLVFTGIEIAIGGNIPKYSVSPEGILLIDGQIISKAKSLELASHLFDSNSINKEKSNKYLATVYSTLNNYRKICYAQFATGATDTQNYREDLKIQMKIEGAKIALQILQYADKVKASDLISEKQAKLNKIEEFLLHRTNKLQKRSFQKSETTESKIVTIPVLDSFDKFLEQIKINIPESKWDSIEVKKVSLDIDKYTIESEASTDTTQMTFKMTSFAGTSSFSKSNIAKDGFTLANEKYSQNLASIFDDFDSSELQDSFVVVKANILIKLNGVDRVVSKEYQFITYVDSDDELESEPEYGKLTSAIRDAVSSEAIADARITLLPINITNNTDENGNYSFSKLPPNTYDVRVAKEGYKTVTIYDVTLGDGEVKNIEILLAIDDEHAENNGTATITLKDALNGNVVTNGYVKVREGQNNKTGEVVQEVVNSDGNQNVHISLYPNTYTVEIGANGYSKAYNTVTILGDVNGAYEFSITPVLSADQVRAVLTWGETPSDLDSHLVKKTDGSQDYHIFYNNQRPSNADANLDTDDTSSYGPETVTINNVNHASVYTYYVYNYSGGAGSVLPNSGAKLEVYFGDQSRTFYVPNEEGQYWKVFEIVNGEIVPCTTDCVKDDTSTLIRKLDRESALFSNLPSK